MGRGCCYLSWVLVATFLSAQNPSFCECGHYTDTGGGSQLWTGRPTILYFIASFPDVKSKFSGIRPRKDHMSSESSKIARFKQF